MRARYGRAWRAWTLPVYHVVAANDIAASTAQKKMEKSGSKRHMGSYLAMPCRRLVACDPEAKLRHEHGGDYGHISRTNGIASLEGLLALYGG